MPSSSSSNNSEKKKMVKKWKRMKNSQLEDLLKAKGLPNKGKKKNRKIAKVPKWLWPKGTA